MFFLTPRYIKQAKLLHKGVMRFLHYKRDLLPAAKLDEIDGLRTQLEEAIKRRDREQLETLSKTINKTCEKAMPEARSSELAENVEVFFVSIVIALGIRTYIAQPFQIPTGSMQPTLNGIIMHRTQEDERPFLGPRFVDWFRGRTPVNVLSDRDGRIVSITERTWDFSPFRRQSFSVLTPHTVLTYDDGSVAVIPGPKEKVVSDLGLGESLGLSGRVHPSILNPEGKPIVFYDSDLRGSPVPVRKGQLLARGTIDWGDHVIVNKFAYHFRTPTRGEVFVFTTKNISGINVPAGHGSQHYIKRLAGVPGDSLAVEEPNLYLNGKLAEEPGFKRVMQGTRQNPVDGYQGYESRGMDHVKLEEAQYFAMGDNSFNSSDSRYWGHVPQQNIVGPGWMCYWPLTKHWGWIR